MRMKPVSRDSLGVFVLGNPVNYNDPKGHCIEDFCIGEAIIMGALISAGVNAGIQVVGNMRNKMRHLVKR